MQGVLRKICISEKRGTAKHPADEAVLRTDHGIEGDAHAGTWHRQVSLLAAERIDAFQAKGAQVVFGAFGENLVTEGIALSSLPVGTRLQIGTAVLEVTQIGKDCHDHCAIYDAVGDCIMPREGIFTKVISGGAIRPGMEITVRPPDPERPYTAAVITLSDRCAKGERSDESGAMAVSLLQEAGYEVAEKLLLSDDRLPLEAQLIRLSDQRQLDLILTTGGTGFSPRDNTPEATVNVCEKMAPGIAEALRAYSLSITKNAMLSRGVSGIRGKSLIVNLPGSKKAVREELTYLLSVLPHALDLIRGTGDN